ncbi:MAG: chorismate mutase [Atopobiaceae bacterium]|nr:chorismate mutase [Atopobiaceae bacterium]
MRDLNEIRKRIDEIDDGILSLFTERTEIADEVAEYKIANNLPVMDRARERSKIAKMIAKTPREMADQVAILFNHLIETSRARQNKLMGTTSAPVADIEAAMAATDPLFPGEADVACQGVEGAYSQIAADKLFKRPFISYFDTFDGVFRAIEQGFCRYGVLPVENSTAGTVNQVYDLMMRHDFHIVRSVRIKVDHNLLAKPGATLEGIREIYSHQQAISQCSGFLDSLSDVEVHVCDNTAMAARMVAESDRTDIAALSSKSCADLYGLSILRRNVQDKGNNYTRFACISKDLEIYPGSDRTSLMIIVNHEPGALYKVLSRFYSLDINIIKLESRPLPDRDFEFMFYFDLECQVVAPEFKALLSTLEDVCEEVRYLGSYTEII